MNRKFLAGMAEATALTRAGKLTDATEVLQRMLQGSTDEHHGSVEDATADGDIIDGVFTVAADPLREPAGKGTAPKPDQGAATPKPRKPLGATLRDISRGGMPDTGHRTARPLGKDANFTLHRHNSAAGSRDFMVFLPHPMPTTPCPVVVMLHGCTQSPQDFADGTQMNALAHSEGVIVVYPAQPVGANMNKCWNWFRPEDQQRETGELAIVAAITRDVLLAQNADPARVYVAGLSAGGAAAVLLAQAYPDLFAAVGVHSGLAAGAATDMPQAFAAMRNGASGTVTQHKIPTIVFHGTADTTVHIDNAHAVVEQAQRGLGGKRSTTKSTPANGRSYDRTILKSAEGTTLGEVWLIHGAGHAWAGGSTAGSFTDPKGPDASAEMLRFFAQHRRD
ncbi:MAG: PHB depolymerase family esterase [Pseudotabrizicola sp.]|uniref:extracellular catalytic domain type 1 short-chain-length polyhydroxyalkanoate depolymerase n=1 Tax=Pseudotabrizicola sp. TaxID=2939647 RepID=UPI00271A47AC|nr:PHB depolymerase family esterase [Pseudotabrizicola sp.]MDO8883688.1 PHB depolymerase family esterase [Pseudotabrizicola sp.]MDP2082405.1 PHB depolymerase family esterase [Pseudotabrizicola sp.]MDZ7574158.1 PHB depolymerase family esterase [Pseudotabrizicola sp.]